MKAGLFVRKTKAIWKLPKYEWKNYRKMIGSKKDRLYTTQVLDEVSENINFIEILIYIACLRLQTCSFLYPISIIHVFKFW